MTGSNGKTQEITLGDEFDAVVHYGDTTVEMHPGGDLIVKTNGNAVVYTNGDVKVRPAANDSAAISAEPQIGDVMPAGHKHAGWIYAGISKTTHEPFYVAPKDSGVFQWKKAMVFASREGSRVPSQMELDQIYEAREQGALNGTFNQTGSNPAGWYWSSRDSHDYAWAQRFRDGDQLSYDKSLDSSLRLVR